MEGRAGLQLDKVELIALIGLGTPALYAPHPSMNPNPLLHSHEQ